MEMIFTCDVAGRAGTNKEIAAPYSLLYKQAIGVSQAEVVAEHLLQEEHFGQLLRIPAAPRFVPGDAATPYYVASHFAGQADEIPLSNGKIAREEEWLAKKMLGKEYDGLGVVFDYQVPLKSYKTPGRSPSKGLGKIDLLAYAPGVITLVELKTIDSKEPLLRPVLEIYSYWKTVGGDPLDTSAPAQEARAAFKRSCVKMLEHVAPQMAVQQQVEGAVIEKAVMVFGKNRKGKETPQARCNPEGCTYELLKKLGVGLYHIHCGVSVSPAALKAPNREDVLRVR